MTVDFKKAKNTIVKNPSDSGKTDKSSTDFSKPTKVKIVDIIEKTAKTGRIGWTIWVSAGGHKYYTKDSLYSPIYFNALSLTIWFDETMENVVYYGNLSDILNTAELKSTHLIEKLEEAFKKEVDLGPIAAQCYYNVDAGKFYFGEPYVVLGDKFEPLETIRTHGYNENDVVKEEPSKENASKEQSKYADEEDLPF